MGLIGYPVGYANNFFQRRAMEPRSYLVPPRRKFWSFLELPPRFVLEEFPPRLEGLPPRPRPGGIASSRSVVIPKLSTSTTIVVTVVAATRTVVAAASTRLMPLFQSSFHRIRWICSCIGDLLNVGWSRGFRSGKCRYIRQIRIPLMRSLLGSKIRYRTWSLGFLLSAVALIPITTSGRLVAL